VLTTYIETDMSRYLFFCRYECIENDLLGSLQLGIHNITPYRSNGIERASDFYSSQNSKEAVGQSSDCGTSGKSWNFTSLGWRLTGNLTKQTL